MPCRCDALSCLVAAGRSAPATSFYLRIVRVLLKYDFFTVPGSWMREVPKKNSACGREACRRWPPDGQAKGPKRIVARKTGSGEGCGRSALSSQNPRMGRSSRSNRSSAQTGSADPSKRGLKGCNPLKYLSRGVPEDVWHWPRCIRQPPPAARCAAGQAHPGFRAGIQGGCFGRGGRRGGYPARRSR